MSGKSVWDRGGQAMKIFGVCGSFIVMFEKVYMVKNEWPRGVEKFHLLRYFQSRNMMGM